MNAEQFLRGVEQFNRGYYFECHDTLEDLWQGTRGVDRQFLQGLIQVSVGFYHLFNRNYRGASSQFTRGMSKLDVYRPVHQGIELEPFLRDMVAWLAKAERGVTGVPPDVDESKVPKLQFTTRHLFEGDRQWQQ